MVWIRDVEANDTKSMVSRSSDPVSVLYSIAPTRYSSIYYEKAKKVLKASLGRRSEVFETNIPRKWLWEISDCVIAFL